MRRFRKKHPKGYILYHMGSLGITAIDVFVRRDLAERKKYQRIKEELYQVEECPHVKKFLETHEDYVYLGSEDTGHIPEFTSAVLGLIWDLKRMGFVEEISWLGK